MTDCVQTDLIHAYRDSTNTERLSNPRKSSFSWSRRTWAITSGANRSILSRSALSAVRSDIASWRACGGGRCDGLRGESRQVPPSPFRPVRGAAIRWAGRCPRLSALSAETSSTDPFGPACDRGDDGHTELALKRPDVDRDPRSLRDVDHVERDDGRYPVVDDLADEVEVPLEVARVDDADDRVGKGRVPCVPEEDIGGDLLVGRTGREAVRPGQVEERRLRSPAGPEPAFFPLDGDARDSCRPSAGGRSAR